MEKEKTRQPFRKALFAFGALRGIELSALVGSAAVFDTVAALANGSAVHISLVGPLLAAAAFYLSFAYIGVSAIAFLLLWLSRKPSLIKLVNALPLFLWGLLALYVVFASNIPLALTLALMSGVVVNWLAAGAFESKGINGDGGN